MIGSRRNGDSNPTCSASSLPKHALRPLERCAEGQVSWGSRGRPVDRQDAEKAENRSPEAICLRSSRLGRFGTGLKNPGKRPVSARSPLAVVRTPLARNPYFGSEHFGTEILQQLALVRGRTAVTVGAACSAAPWSCHSANVPDQPRQTTRFHAFIGVGVDGTTSWKTQLKSPSLSGSLNPATRGKLWPMASANCLVAFIFPRP